MEFFDSTTKRPAGFPTGRLKLSVVRPSGSQAIRQSVPAAGPGRNLAALRNRAEALVDELLQALAGVGFRRVEVALRVDGNAVHAEEHAGLTAAITKAIELGHRLAVVDANVLVRAVGHVEEALLGILREGDVPHR